MQWYRREATDLCTGTQYDEDVSPEFNVIHPAENPGTLRLKDSSEDNESPSTLWPRESEEEEASAQRWR